jgi:geranylgeranyl diphosphate synthase, type I
MNKHTSDEFLSTLGRYQTAIDMDIAEYCRVTEAEVANEFGEYPLESVKLFTSLLSRGGKRLRGALVMHSYYMFGGTDEKVALKAARVLEMLQTYMLMMDDIQDRSDMRRGGPAAHILMRDYHAAHHFAADSDHFGVSIALCALGFGFHSAMVQLADIDVSADLIVKAMKSANQNYAITGHGQVLDIFNEVVRSVEEKTIYNVLEWKSAYYTFVSPLHFGAILAGVSNGRLDILKDYGLRAGKVFQITDDIIGIFSDEAEAGKSPMDDIKEGKRTILSTKALASTSGEDKDFFVSMLGNQYITEDDFDRCREIVRSCGALDYAGQCAQNEAESARSVLQVGLGDVSKEHIDFLYDILDYMIERKK